MRAKHYFSLLLIVAIVLTVAVFLVQYLNKPDIPRDQAWQNVPQREAHVDHSHYFDESFADGPAVTAACLACHKEEAHEFMETSHWLWSESNVMVPGHSEPQTIGKKNLINNFCISVESNWPKCTSCHAGYGWKDATFDFSDPTKIDCLVCHDRSGQYFKGESGIAAAGVDLLASAKSVDLPDRTNCGICHFNGGGGDAVKHGDLDQTMYFPTRDIDVHMGGLDFTCIDCHRGQDHQVVGNSMSVSVDNKKGLACTECHVEAPHRSERLNAHVSAVACQTCHIPEFAVREATKVSWDWSEAGQDLPITDKHVYMKIKGRFEYEKGVVPEYYWYNGNSTRYLKGDLMDPDQATNLNHPLGDVHDETARIWPFKVHRGRQVYDTEYKTFLVPQTVGKGAYWDAFDWDQALRMAEKSTGLPYSGSYGFAPTQMFWPLSHMVAPQERSLQCVDCHGADGRMDWQALGYSGDPAQRGGRAQTRQVIVQPGASNDEGGTR